MNELMTADTNIGLMRAAQQQAMQSAQMLKNEGQIKNFEQIEEAAEEFEAVFLTEMMKPMFAEVHKPNPLFGGGHGEKVFNGFMVQEYGKLMAQQGGVGLAEHVKAEMIRIQEAQKEQE